MYFRCPHCGTALRVDPARLPDHPVRYTCKDCGRPATVQEHLHESPAGTAGLAPDAPPSMDGTVYHHLSQEVGDLPRASYELRCAVKDLGGGVRTFRFDQPKVTIGRRGADIVLDDPLTSRLHAELERVRDQVVVKDLDSTNGTFVNDQRITVQVLDERDLVRVGNTILRAAAKIKDR